MGINEVPPLLHGPDSLTLDIDESEVIRFGCLLNFECGNIE